MNIYNVRHENKNRECFILINVNSVFDLDYFSALK